METGCAERVLIEELPFEQYDSLAGVHEGFIPPKGSVALVARQGDAIVGRVFLMAPVHLEGPWAREDFRNRMLGYRLMKAAAEKAKECGVKKLFAYAENEQLANYLSRLGYKQEPYTVWTKEL